MASLQYIQSSTLQSVTLGSAYTAGAGTMTLTAGNGAYLPSSGDFWLSYNNGAGTIRLFKVTARSTDTLTVVAVSGEGSGDGNISSGETLRWALTYDALNQLRSDISGYGTYANLPATCVTGDQYKTSDSGYSFVATATNTWQAFYKGFPVTRPVSGDFAWINQGSASVTSGAGAIVLYAPAVSGSNSLRIRKKTAPATPYTIEAGFDVNFGFSNFAEAGLCYRQSSDGKVVTAAIQYNTGLVTASAKWTNETTFSAAYTLTTPPYGNTQTVFIRISDDGANRIFSWSPNLKDWTTLHTVTRTDFLTADEVGFYANNSNNIPVYLNLFHWKQS